REARRARDVVSADHGICAGGDRTEEAQEKGDSARAPHSQAREAQRERRDFPDHPLAVRELESMPKNARIFEARSLCAAAMWRSSAAASSPSLTAASSTLRRASTSAIFSASSGRSRRISCAVLLSKR